MALNVTDKWKTKDYKVKTEAGGEYWPTVDVSTNSEM